MKLYHSSNVSVEFPDTLHSRDDLDFGKGFYLTPIKDQAISYAQRFQRRMQDAWLNIYELTYSTKDWKEKVFYSYDKEWLDFISECRAGRDCFNFDIVIGGIANDKDIRTLDRYFQGEISSEQALGILKYEKPNIQYCIRNQEMIDNCLKHISSIQL
ncbi:MAG: DUF3990 domain-containing protein [Muribaculaceae bacterium]|nr:DUF3990 domain-containing protein [Muribaculaceae bacterium]